MIQNKHIVNCLPLLAAVLGRKYGVEVRIGGQTACTNGRIIQLPALPLDVDEIVLGLVRGYIDHESAHLRATDFSALTAAGLSPLEFHIWNILEDWRVEQKLAAVFPGCRENFLWLIRHLFLNPNEAHQEPNAKAPATEISNWLLFSVRAWDAPEVAHKRDASAQVVDQAFPGLLPQLEILLRTAPSRLVDTAETICLAREIVDVLHHYLRIEAPAQAANGRLHNAGASSGTADMPAEAPTDGLELMVRNGFGLPDDLGEILRESLSIMSGTGTGKLRVAGTGTKPYRPLSPEAERNARSTTTALRTRLQALLQGRRLAHCGGFRQGRLCGRRLHRIFIHDPRVFQQKIEQPGLDAFVQILLDASGSMSGRPMELAGQACFAVASALAPIPGVTAAVGVFPGVQPNPNAHGHQSVTVAPILNSSERPHNRFSMDASGGTPMAEALWWALQQLQFRPEKRKIILLISDGEPDDLTATKAAVSAMRANGCELYGIGIETVSLSKLLHTHSRTIGNITELAASLFDLLEEALL